jgi:hypothetical protein
MPNAIIEAVANVIHEAGFHTMATEYRTRPELRDRIGANMVRAIRNDRSLGPAFADRLARLIQNAKRAA